MYDWYLQEQALSRCNKRRYRNMGIVNETTGKLNVDIVLWMLSGESQADS
jgi:hypothetical protein